MSASAAKARKTTKVYPPADNSKSYDHVPRTPAPKRNPLWRMITKLGVEVGIEGLEPAERVALIAFFGVVLFAVVGGPICLVSWLRGTAGTTPSTA